MSAARTIRRLLPAFFFGFATSVAVKFSLWWTLPGLLLYAAWISYGVWIISRTGRPPILSRCDLGRHRWVRDESSDLMAHCGRWGCKESGLVISDGPGPKERR